MSMKASMLPLRQKNRTSMLWDALQRFIRGYSIGRIEKIRYVVTPPGVETLTSSPS